MRFIAELSDGTEVLAQRSGMGRRREDWSFALPDDRPFASVSVTSDNNLGGVLAMIRFAGRVFVDKLDCSGVLKLRSLRVDLERAEDGAFVFDKWPGMETFNLGRSLWLLAPMTGELHHVPTGGSINRRVYVHKSGAAEMPSLLATGDWFGPLQVNRQSMRVVMGAPFPVSAAAQLAAPLSIGVGLDSWVPAGSAPGEEPDPQGDDGGGSGIHITPWEEIAGDPAALEYCLTMALRQACRTDTLALGADHLPLNPHGFPSLHAFDAYAGTSDSARLPHLNSWPAGKVYNDGHARSETPLKKYKQHNDEHWPRSAWGLLGLIHWLDEWHPVRMWALETFYSRCCVLWMEIPDLPASGLNWPGIIANWAAGFFDRDEGWTFYASAMLDSILSTRPAHLSSKALEVRHWHETVASAFTVAALENGCVQAVPKGQKHWTTNPYAPDENGNELDDTDKAAYAFQLEICAFAGLLSNDVRPNPDVLEISELMLDFLASKSVDSSSFDVNGGKRGTPDIIASDTARGVPETIGNFRGAGVLTNGLAGHAFVGELERVYERLGKDVDTPAKALAVIRADTLAGYSGSLKWSAIAAQVFHELVLTGPPTRPEPEPEPPATRPDPNPDVPPSGRPPIPMPPVRPPAPERPPANDRQVARLQELLRTETTRRRRAERALRRTRAIATDALKTER